MTAGEGLSTHLEAAARPAAAVLAQPLVGRGRERAALRRAVSRAMAGRPAVVLVEGDAGIGKSALLAHAAAAFEAAGGSMLRASGDEAEASLHLGVLSQLVVGVSPLPEALSGLGRGRRELDPLAAGAALLELLGELQDGGPVAIVVDDAHWADSASLHALAFCLRRLRADHVLVMLAARGDETARLPAGLVKLASDMTLMLEGLGATELVELARALGAGVLSRRAAERLARHTAGNPLLAIALFQELGAALLSRPGELELHAPRSFASVVLARLAACGQSGRDLLAAGSVLGLRWPLVLAATIAELDDPLAAADQAAQASLFSVQPASDGLVGSFPHPLTRAAIYRELPLARRALLHRRAAELVDDPRDALRHRVEAEIGPNRELADELIATARHDAAAGSWGAAARANLWAARVVADRRERERRVLDAVVCLLLAGDVEEARALLGDSEGFVDSAPLHFDRGYLAMTDGAFAVAEKQLRQSWEGAREAGDSELAARAADLISSVCVYLGRGAAGIRWAWHSLEASAGSLPGGNPRTSLLVGYGISGRAAEGLAVARDFDIDGTEPWQSDGLVGRGTIKLWADDPEGARADLLAVAESCLRRGPLDRGMFAAVHLADAEWRLGRWDDALVHADAGVSAASSAAHGWFIAEAHAVAALPLTGRGEWEAAESHVRGAVESAKRVGYGHGSLWAIVARARLADARADPERVVHVLTPLLAFSRADGVDHPGIHAWRELLGAALVALDRAEEAVAHAEALESQAKALALRSARARGLRLTGLIEASRRRHDEAVRQFEAALAELEPLRQPFDRALFQADLGSALRRAGRRRAAADRLNSARATLVRLGAAPYVERIDRELSACGLHPAREAAARERLTPAEFSVAQLVAQGKTNREVAATLVLSAKTIEHHLGRIYQKLGIASRTQLALQLREGR